MPEPSFIKLELTILAIDSDYDNITNSAYQYRQQSVYPYLEEQGLIIERCQGTMASRDYIEPIARKTNIVYITGSGHGFPNEFTGDRGFTIFRVGQYSPEESQGKIIHLLSCSTAFGLGRDMIRHGCQAFFGYDIPFIYVPEISEVFWECDAEIDRAFAQGMTAREVYDCATQRYEQSIKYYENRFVEALINGTEEARVLGAVFSSLMRNYEHLCSPSKDKQWGSLDAKLF